MPLAASQLLDYRRRIMTGERAKVVAYVWEEEFIQFFAAPTVLPNN